MTTRSGGRRSATPSFFFFDRAFLENLVIAKYRLNQQDLTQDEFDILCKLAHGIASLMPPVDKYLYLDCSVSTIIVACGQFDGSQRFQR